MKLVRFGGNALMENGSLIRSNNLSDNTWEEIAQQIANGTAPSKWIGQTKTVQTSRGEKTFMCVDNTYGRYQKADGTYTTLTFLYIGTFNDLFGAISGRMADSSKLYNESNQGITCASYLRNYVTDTSLKKVLQKTNCKYINKDSDGYLDYTNMLDFESEFFTPSVAEIRGGGADTFDQETKSYLTGNVLNRYTYFANMLYSGSGYAMWTRTIANYLLNAWTSISAIGNPSDILGNSSLSGFMIAFAL